jgi:hypothetical protein
MFAAILKQENATTMRSEIERSEIRERGGNF